VVLASYGAAAATSTFGVIFGVMAVVFLAAAALVWRGSRIGYIIALVVSALFILLFGFEIQAALTGFADLTTFLEVLIILPSLVLVFVYSILGVRLVWKKGQMPGTGRMMPVSSVLALLTLGFVIGGAAIGVLANGAVLAIGKNSNVTADITIAVGSSNPATAMPFAPTNLTVKAGANVTWVNRDPATHTVTSTSVPTGASSFDSGNLPYGITFSVKLTVPGTYHYFCSIHPSMQGTILVTP